MERINFQVIFHQVLWSTDAVRFGPKLDTLTEPKNQNMLDEEYTNKSKNTIR